MKPAFNLSVYLVTDPAINGGRPVDEVVERAVAGGVTMVQLRDPVAHGRHMVELARRLRQILAPRGIPLIVNDRVDVAIAAGADGVHVGQRDIDAADVRRLVGPDMILGLSVGNAAELAASRDALAFADYVGVGPVHATGTKPDAGAAIGNDGIAFMRGETSLPLVAIGGLNAGNSAAAITAGAEGVAIVSAIMAAPDPAAAAAQIAAVVSDARRAA